MAINIYNKQDLWTVKFYKEEWFFKDTVEFVPVLDFLVLHRVSFQLNIFNNNFYISMKDCNLDSVAFVKLLPVLNYCLDYKMKFGDRSRISFTPPECLPFRPDEF